MALEDHGFFKRHPGYRPHTLCDVLIDSPLIAVLDGVVAEFSVKKMIERQGGDRVTSVEAVHEPDIDIRVTLADSLTPLTVQVKKAADSSLINPKSVTREGFIYQMISRVSRYDVGSFDVLAVAFGCLCGDDRKVAFCLQSDLEPSGKHPTKLKGRYRVPNPETGDHEYWTYDFSKLLDRWYRA